MNASTRLMAGLLAALVLNGCVYYVRQGHVGLLVNDFSGDIEQVLEPGYRNATPIRQHIVEYPVIVQQYVMVRGNERGSAPHRDDAVRVNSLEGQTFTVDTAVEFRIRSKADVPDLYRRYGLPFDEIVNNYYRSKFKAAIVTAVASLPLAEAITGAGRRRVEAMALADLRRMMQDEFIVVDEVLIRGVYLPDAIADAIAAKTRAESDLERARTAAQQRIVEAEAEAKARQIRAAAEAEANRALAATLTEPVLRKHYIDKLSDKIQVVLPSNGLYTFGDVLPAASPSPASRR